MPTRQPLGDALIEDRRPVPGARRAHAHPQPRATARGRGHRERARRGPGGVTAERLAAPGVLHRAGILSRHKQGTHVRYAIADPSVFELCELVCGGPSRHLVEMTSAFHTEAAGGPEAA